MPTTVVKSIGSSSRDYSTLQSWEDACPSNLVTSDQIWQGECYNDSEFSSSSSLLTISGQTVDSTRYVVLKCAAGQSFRDNANVQTNALRYNQSNGVGVRCTGGYAQAITVSTQYTRIEGLQVQCSNNSQALYNTSNNCDFNFCIFESARSGSGYAVELADSGTKLRNSLVVNTTSGGGRGVLLYNGASAYNVTCVKPSDVTAAQTAFTRSYGTPILKNCAGFGYTDFTNSDASFSSSSGNNCTDDSTAPGSSNQVSKTYANQFQNTTNASRDFRLKTGSDCIDNGATDSTNAAIDIAGTSRPSGSAYDIGCWELVSAGGGGTALKDMIGTGIIPWAR